MDFKEAFKFPLELNHGMVLTKDHDRAFDFANKYNYPNGFHIGNLSKGNVVKVINGEDVKIPTDLKLSYDSSSSMIYTEIIGEKQEFISIRGWGHLTGSGGLRLSNDVAVKIQNDFANYIVETLTRACQP